MFCFMWIFVLHAEAPPHMLEEEIQWYIQIGLKFSQVDIFDTAYVTV